jgi:hypothetical protein
VDASQSREVVFSSRAAGGDKPASEPSGSQGVTIPQGSTSQPTTTLRPSTGSDATLNLYGSHYRRVPGIPQPRAAEPEKQEWFLVFPEGLHPSQVLEISYDDGLDSGLGRAYKYTSNVRTHSLRLDGATAKANLRMDGFTCRDEGPATYKWSRFNNNYVLRLTAVDEPCAVRRTILEGDWKFLD